MQQVISYLVIGEEGGHSRLETSRSFSPDHLNGAESRMKSQNRRGYVATLEGDAVTGKLTVLRALNGPSVAFEEVERRFREKNRTRGSSNVVFWR